MNARSTTRVRSGPAKAATHATEFQPMTPLEQEVARLQSRLDRLKTDVDQVRRLSTLGSATTKIAHEFNNWLTPILNRVNLALATSGKEDIEKALKATQNGAKVLCHYSERILALAAAKPVQREAASLHTAIELAREALCRDFRKDGIRFVNEVPETLTVNADALQLQQVFFNLLGNAHDAFVSSRRSGRIAVSAARNGDRVTITVKDTGPGIPKALAPHLFEPFETSKQSTRDGKLRCGGLGLTICRDLVEENGGRISVTSEEGVGTSFTIELPAADSLTASVHALADEQAVSERSGDG
jgi:signal transduction histidine kinase